MAVLPAEIPTGLVKGQFYFVSADEVDADTNPELQPVSGFVRFTASVDILRMPSKSVTVIPLSFDAKFNSNGELTPVGDTKVGLRLPATDSDLINPQGFTWLVEFHLSLANDKRIQIPSFHIQVPEGKTVDLTAVMPIESSEGVQILQGPMGPAGKDGDGAQQDAIDALNKAMETMVDGKYDTPAPSEIFGALTDNVGNLSPFVWTDKGRLHSHARKIIGEDAGGYSDGDDSVPTEIFGALTDEASNLSPFAWTRKGRLHSHSSRIIMEDAAGFSDVTHVPGVLVAYVDMADNLIATVGMNSVITPAIASGTAPAPAPTPTLDLEGSKRVPVLPRKALLAPELTRWSWWGSSTMGHMSSRLTAMGTRRGATTMYGGGNGGESAEHTLARFGSRPASLTAPVTIPASGPVNIELDLPVHNGAIGWDVNLAGIRGVASKANGSTQYVFTRTSAGTATKVFAGSPLASVKGEESRGGLLILNIGKNNLTGVSGTRDVKTLVDWTMEAYNYATHTVLRVLVLGHWLDRDATPAEAEWDKILDYNQRVKNLLPSTVFLDTHAMVTDPGVWAKTGITPTAQDTAAQAAGTKPPSLSSDSLHLNDAGHDVLDAAIEAKLLSLGWIK